MPYIVRRLILLAIVSGFAAVVWYGSPMDILVYTALVLLGLWVWGSIVLDSIMGERKAEKTEKQKAKDRVLDDININCEVKDCCMVSEMECLGIKLCYAHWRLLRPRGLSPLWGFKQKGDGYK